MPSPPTPPTLPRGRRPNAWPSSLRLALLRALERAAAWRTPRPAAAGPATTAGDGGLWLFVSTIGELNAVEPLVRRLLVELGSPPLTLISDRLHYFEAYQAKFPAAALAYLDGTAAAADALARRRPPRLLVVAEIPALLHDAPCRLSYSTLHAAKRAGAPVVLVNGWLYGYTPPSRMDRVENRLFRRDYLQAFDLLLVQTAGVRERLLAEGAAPSRLVVTGNIKFDAMQPALAGDAAAPLRDALQARKAAGHGPVVVAGSVSETADQQALLAALHALRAVHPGALLVLAPRHPENRARMSALQTLLDASGLPWRWRSRVSPAVAVDAAVLVLDTMGELRGCYAAADWAYVGTDHNVLEPLTFGRPVFVSGPWNPTYPSYPVYAQLRDAGVLRVVDDPATLGAAWLDQAADADAGAPAQRLDEALTTMRGAVGRSLVAMRASPDLGRLWPHEAAAR